MRKIALFEENRFKSFENFKLVQIPTTMARGGAHIAGTNRSGTKRRRAMSENSTADGPEAGRNLVE